MLDGLRERARSILLGKIKLPGWAAILFAVVTGVPDWKSRLDFWVGAVAAAGGSLGMVATAIASPYFSPALAVAGVAYLLLVGEPKTGVQRHPWWPYVGWSIFSICFAASVARLVDRYLRKTNNGSSERGAKALDHKDQCPQRAFRHKPCYPFADRNERMAYGLSLPAALIAHLRPPASVSIPKIISFRGGGGAKS
jgi:hypothetical protein